MGMKEIKSYEDLQQAFVDAAEEKYREFAQKLTPSGRLFVGVRIPVVRRIVNMIPVGCYEKFLKMKPVTIEEVLARGMMIGKLPYEEMLKWFDSQVEFIDDWSTCDIFCAGLKKTIVRHREEFLDLKVEPLLRAKDEFAVRVGLVILKCAYVESNYLQKIFEWVESLGEREEYYVRMAIAWLLSECFIKYPSATTGYLVDSGLPEWTFNKTIAKICDSYRVDAETKKMLKKMRR